MHALLILRVSPWERRVRFLSLLVHELIGPSHLEPRSATLRNVAAYVTTQLLINPSQSSKNSSAFNAPVTNLVQEPN